MDQVQMDTTEYTATEKETIQVDQDIGDNLIVEDQLTQTSVIFLDSPTGMILIKWYMLPINDRSCISVFAGSIFVELLFLILVVLLPVEFFLILAIQWFVLRIRIF